MGGCTSKPKELDVPNAVAPVENSVPQPEVIMKPVETEAPKEEIKSETTTEAPLVDLSSLRPEAEKAPVLELAPEINELKANEPATVEAVILKDDAPAESMVAPAVEEKEKDSVVAEKVEQAKEPAVVADEKTEKVSAQKEETAVF